MTVPVTGLALLGAEPVPGGTRFTVASNVAERVELVLFDGHDVEADRVDLAPDGTGDWSVEVAGTGPGQHYGFRVHGPGDPSSGHACDPAKLLVDPAARLIAGSLAWTAELTAPGVDSAPFVPRSVVVAPVAPVDPALRPQTPWDNTVVYEAHVGHLTARHPLVPAPDRGRYPGLAAPAVIDHLRRIGVTAVELLPVQQFTSERDLVARGEANVWGYNPLAWGAPHAGYATAGGDPARELRAAVAALHDAGIEVWLDIVVNHTCEGGLGTGPILSWRGFDNAGAYRLRPGPDGLVDDDVTGCGNAIDARSPWMRRLIRQCLDRWITEYGVDGFRFDLAATLIRGEDGPSGDAPWLEDIAGLAAEHPGVKLVAEPWDIGPGGYALGRFPAPWREWNDRFRDGTRDVWADRGTWPTAARGLMGSGEVFRASGRSASASINAVTTHDGFTLADLVTYDEPTDGAHGQRSWSGGLEGPTTDPAVVAGRRQRQRALLATVLFAQGVPLLVAGDEVGRTQGGRADGYTLDPVEWGVPWPDADWDLSAWTAAAAALRHRHPVLRRSSWVDPDDERVTWHDAAGSPLTGVQWEDPDHPALRVDLDGTDLGDQRVALLVADGAEEVTFVVGDGEWEVALHAGDDRPPWPWARPVVTGSLTVAGPVFVVLVCRG